MKETTIRRPIESITRQKPYDTFFSSALQVGGKPSRRKAKVKQKLVSDRQLLTGAPPRI